MMISIIRGIALVFALHLGFGLLILLISSIANSSGLPGIYKIGVAIFPWPGLTQFCYLLPIVLYYRRLGESKMIKGILIGVILTLLLNLVSFRVTL